MSDFYDDQLDALARFQNPTVFTVNFSVQCVKAYLDALHGIRAENASMATTLELIKFLKDLARGKKISIKQFRIFNIQDKSQFEGELLTYLCEQVEKAKIDVQTKLLITMVSNTFDNFNGHFEKVH